jgi:hypothetical protein
MFRTEELSKTCRVVLQNKFEKLLHLVGFIIRIYHDARSPERQSVQLYAFLVLLQRIWNHSFYGLCPSYLISNKIKIITLMGTTGPHPQVKKVIAGQLQQSTGQLISP